MPVQTLHNTCHHSSAPSSPNTQAHPVCCTLQSQSSKLASIQFNSTHYVSETTLGERKETTIQSAQCTRASTSEPGSFHKHEHRQRCHTADPKLPTRKSQAAAIIFVLSLPLYFSVFPSTANENCGTVNVVTHSNPVPRQHSFPARRRQQSAWFIRLTALRGSNSRGVQKTNNNIAG